MIKNNEDKWVEYIVKETLDMNGKECSEKKIDWIMDETAIWYGDVIDENIEYDELVLGDVQKFILSLAD